MGKDIREILYRSFDESLTPEEDQILQEALEKSKTLREEKESIAIMRQSVSDSAAKSFEPFFAERVMQKIQTSSKIEKGNDPFFESLFNLFRPLALGAAVLTIILLSYNIIKSDRVSLAGAFAEPVVTLEEAFDPALTLALE